MTVKKNEMISDTQLLINEIYHRMRNNLQVITSVIRKKNLEMNHEQTIDLIENVVTKITNMEIIYPYFEVNRFQKYNLNEVFAKLSTQMKSLHSFNEREINFEINTNKISLNAITVTFLSRIVNELIINSYKHAFDKQKTGLIKINIKKTTYNNYVMIYSDNGNCSNDINQKNNSTSLGLEMVKLFVERLNGTLNYKIDPALEYTIKFEETTT